MKNLLLNLMAPSDAKALALIVRITGSGYQKLFSTVTSKLMPPVH